MSNNDIYFIENDIRSRLLFRLGAIALITAVVLAIVCAGLPTSITRGTVKRVHCSNNLRQIVIALHNYHDAYHQFPPAFTTDDSGNRLHSWRVLILPFLEYQTLYDAIDLERPWNHPDNVQFHAQMPDVFRCPEDDNADPHLTTYVSVIGPDLFWDESGKSRTLDDVSDGASATLCLIESDSNPINWMSPYHFTWQELAANLQRGTFNKTGDPERHIVGGHDGLGVCGRVDGSVGVIGSDLELEEIHKFLTHASGEAMEND